MGLFQNKKTLDILAGIDLVLTDLDGVLYRGGAPITSGVQAFNQLAQHKQVAYLTNNASRTDAQVAAKLVDYGLQATPDTVVTSPQAAIELLRKTVPPGALIFVTGGEGITYELEKAGYRYTRSANDLPDAVVQGFSPDLTWAHLAETAFALATRPCGTEIPWIATNTDWTIPLEQGLAPGNGSLVSAVHNAVQRLPQFAGKPEPAMFETVFSRFDTRRALMIGDRLDTDIQGANSVNIPSVHVLTGVDRPKQLLAAAANMRPTYIVATLAELFVPYPATVVKPDGTHCVGSARVRLDGHVVRILREGDNPLNLLRAACAAIYASGLAIYGLEVPEILVADHWQ